MWIVEHHMYALGWSAHGQLVSGDGNRNEHNNTHRLGVLAPWKKKRQNKEGECENQRGWPHQNRHATYEMFQTSRMVWSEHATGLPFPSWKTSLRANAALLR